MSPNPSSAASPSSTPTFSETSSQVAFALPNEDHTIGNVLRSLLVRNPAIEFGGYSKPHPAENEIYLRIQTTGTPAVDVLKGSLDDLNQICDHLQDLFDDATHRFHSESKGQ